MQLLDANGEIIRDNVRVLVVDDEDPILKIMILNLVRLKKYSRKNVYIANSGRKGLELLKELHEMKKTPHIFFVDFRMPEIDGASFYQIITEEYETGLEGSVKFLLTGISLNEEKTDLEERLSEAGVEIIYKPFKYSEIITAAEKSLLENCRKNA